MAINSWVYGPVDSFWMEWNTPSGNMHQFHFDALDVSDYTMSLLKLLSSLGVIEYGTSYETIELIRIR